MAATGIPVVSTDHGDIPEVVVHGKSGLLAPERDVPALVYHLRWLIENPHRWHDMAVEGRRHIDTEFNAMIQGKKLAELYSEVLDRR